MYLLFAIIGGVTVGLINGFALGTFFLGALGGVLMAGLIKLIATMTKGSNSSSSSVFDGCIIFLLIGAIFDGL